MFVPTPPPPSPFSNQNPRHAPVFTKWSCDFSLVFSSCNGLYRDRLRWTTGLSAITEKSLGQIGLWKFQAISEEFIDKVYRLAWLPPREVPMVDRYMKIYINHSQTIFIHPVKWHLEIPSRLGGIWWQRICFRPGRISGPNCLFIEIN